MPIRAATCAAAFGICVGIVQFGRMTVSTSDGSTPASASAAVPAATAMSVSSSSFSAKRRSMIPTRVWIHSSLVSMIFERSSLVTIFSGW